MNTKHRVGSFSLTLEELRDLLGLDGEDHLYGAEVTFQDHYWKRSVTFHVESPKLREIDPNTEIPMIDAMITRVYKDGWVTSVAIRPIKEV